MKDLIPPDIKQLQNVKKLCEIKTPYDSNPDLDKLFIKAFKEIIKWHKKNCNFYDNLLKINSFDEQSLESVEDLYNLPFIHANFFKQHEVLSIKKDQVVEHLTSSGTSGQKSQMFFDEWSIKSARRMVKYIFALNGFDTPDTLTNYLLFAYEPYANFKVGTTNTNIFLTSFTKPKDIFFALRYSNGTHEFDKFGVISKLQQYEQEGLPVRIHGFIAFTYFTLKLMKERGIKLSLHPSSMASFGGGWKGYANEEIPKEKFYELLHDRLGIKTQRIRDSYGSVEHSIPYVECKNHHLHVPLYSRLFIRDVKTLEVLGYEKEGFMNFVTPYITSVPALSVMMGDIGVLHRASECSCGAKTPFFEILGRAGVSKNKSCAVSASDLLRKKNV